jgi:hypothetical protein
MLLVEHADHLNPLYLSIGKLNATGRDFPQIVCD